MAQVKPISKKKLSGPAIAAIIVCIAILLGLVASLVASTGVFFRAKDGASSENFEVNASMMEYYTNSIYQSWYSSYYYYILLGYVTFDASTPLDEQTLPSIFKDDEKPNVKTYYDYFADQATTQVTKLLKYCEAAKADGTIDFDDLNSKAVSYADETIKALKESAKSNSMDFTTFLRQNFGEHVNKIDLHNSLVIEYIASEYSNTVYDRFYDGMTDEQKDAYFKENLHEFITAEYLTFTLSQTVSAESVDEKEYITDEYPTGKDNPEYLAAVEKAKEDAKKANDLNKVAAKELINKLAKAANAEEFKRILLDEKYEENFKSAYDTAVKNFADADKPSDEDYKAFMEEVKQQIIDAVINEKDDIYEDEDEDDSTESQADEEKAVSKWETAKKELPASVITKLNSVITSATKTATFYEDKEDFESATDLNKFLFAGVKAQWGVDYADYETKGDNADVNDYLLDMEDYEDNADKQAIGAYSYTVYFVTESAHRDEEPVRNVGHILFKVDETGKTSGAYTSFDSAKEKAEEVLALLNAKLVNGVISEEDFEEIADEYNMDSSNFYYSNKKENSFVTEFNDWLWSDDRKTEGELGLVKTEYGWHIMYFGGEYIAWNYSAHSLATSKALTDWYEALPYEVTVNTSIFESILG